MVRTVFKSGNSHAFRLDKTMMELLGINEETELDVSYSGGSMIVTPIRPTHTRKQFEEAVEKAHEKYGEVLKRLAK